MARNVYQQTAQVAASGENVKACDIWRKQHYDETKKSDYEPQIVREKENHNLSHGGSTKDKHQAQSTDLRAIIDSET